jgi:D-alanine--poly(phosphoribitol) ligase subunit 1
MSDSPVSLLKEGLVAFKDRPAFTIRGESYSYAELNILIQERIDFLQHQYPLALRIGVYCYDSIETYAFMLACLMTGKAYVPIHPMHPAERNAHIESLADLQYIYSPGDALSITDGTTTPLQEIEITDRTIAYILFTSGSTGIPKGVPITHGNLQAFTEACKYAGIVASKEDRFLQMFDLTFDLSVFSYLYPLCHGACVCTVPSDEVKHFGVYRILEEEKISVALMVPSVMEMLKLYFSDIDLPYLRQLLFCGEALRADMLEALVPNIPETEIRNVYGPTEATIFCTSYILPKNTGDWIHKNGILSIGKALSPTRLKISTEGELWIGGPQLTSGYVNQPEKNTQSFTETEGGRWYKSGDSAVMHKSGNILYTGRTDQQVKIQGYRIEPGEIEFQLNQILQTRRGLICVYQKNHTAELHAFIEGVAVDIEEWKNELQKKVPAYMQPSGWHFIPEFPLNVNGKTDRKRIIENLYAE